MTATDRYFSKVILTKRDGLESPNEGSLCIVNLHVSQGEGNVLHEEQNVTWLLGQDSGYVSEVLNDCLEEMHSGDVCKITLHLCDELQDHLKSFNTSENLPVDYKLELVSFEKAKGSWESTFLERCQFAKDQKEKGTRYHKAGLWLFAARHYSKAVKSLILARFQSPSGSSDSSNDAFSLLQIQCYSNLAACQLKLGRYEHVTKNCAKVLNLDSSNMKALFRRAQLQIHRGRQNVARIAVSNFDQAEADIHKALEIDPRNREVLQLKQTLGQKRNKHKTATAKAMSKTFQN